MPISSIQYRLVTERYQRQSHAMRDTQKKIYKKYSECIQSSGQILEANSSSIEFPLKNYSGITVNKQNGIKTTFLLFILINQVICEKNELLNVSSFSKPINKANSSSQVTKGILQNRSISFANRSIDYSKSNLFSTEKYLSAKQPIHKIRAIRSSYFFYKLLGNVNKELFDFLAKKELLGNDNNIRKEEFISAVFNYFYTGKRQSWEITTIILSIFHPHNIKHTFSYPFLSSEYIDKILSEWFFKNIIGTSPIEHVIQSIENEKHSLNYSFNDIIEMLWIDRFSRTGQIRLNSLSQKTENFFGNIWLKNLIIEMPFFYFWHKDKSLGTIPLQELEFSNLYTGAYFLYDFNILDKFNHREASEIGKTIWQIAIQKGVDPSMEPYFWVPSILFATQNFPQKIKKTSDFSKSIITKQLKYRETVQQLSKSIKNELDAYKVSLKKWSNKRGIPDKEELNRVILQVTNNFSTLDKNLLLFAFTSIELQEINFVFSPDAMIHPISFHVQIAKRKHLPVITPIIGQSCFDHKFRTIFCINNRDILNPTPNINIFLENTDLFSVQVENEERIYALKDENYKYSLFRVDRDINKYIDANILDYKSLNVKYFINNNELFTKEKKISLKFINEKPIIKRNITEFISFLANKHSSSLFNSSLQTDSELSTLEKGWDIFKHFISFYDCDLNKNLKNSIPICLIEAAIFNPVGGSKFVAEKLSLKLGKALYKNSIYLEGGKLTRNLSSVNKASIQGKNLFTIENLNFEIRESLNKKYINELISILSQDKIAIFLGKKLKSILSKKSVSFFPDSYIKAYLPNSEIEVSAIKVEKTYNVYVILDPRTGNHGWVRYTMKENKQLVPLQPFPKIKKTKQLREFVTPDMYVQNINIDDLSVPDYYTGLRWDRDYENSYLKFKKNILKIKILDKQPFLVLNNRLVPLIYKNNRLGLGNVS